MHDVRLGLDKTMENLESPAHAAAEMKHLGDDKAAQQLAASRKTVQAQSPLVEHAEPAHHVYGTPGVQHETDAADAADEWWDAHDDRPISLWAQPPGLSFAPSQPPPPIPSSLPQLQRSPKSTQATTHKVSHAAFRLLKDCPKLDILKGECWEIGMPVNQ